MVKKMRINQLMRTTILSAALCCFLITAASIFAQGTAFTYQGQVMSSNSPAHGTYDMTFKLWNASSGGSQVGSTITASGTVITNGLFTVILDFGSQYNGTSYWLELGVRTNGAASFATLSPRQQLTPTPYAIFAEGGSAAGLTGTLPTGDLGGTYGNPITLNNAGNSFSGSGSGLTGLNASQLTSGTVSDLRLSPNVALLNGLQTFTGGNTFAGNPGSFVINNGLPAINTSVFTGLGLQYSIPDGESAIMSSYNDGVGYLSFYTKHGSGFPILKQMVIDYYGGVGIDQQNANSGVFNNGTTNGVGLYFGSGSGEGIASQRTAGGNQYGLDFYTAFAQRMSILNNGNLRINGHTLLLEPASAGSYVNDGLVWGNGGLAGSIANSASAPFLAGYWGGSLGGLSPNILAFSWDAAGNCSVNNNLSTGSLTVRGNYLVVNGGTPVYAYIGDDGAGGDVQIGSQRSGITAVACYNTADNAYMHLYCSSITIEGGADLAEPFKITSGDNEVPQGAVVVIDDKNPGHLKVSDQAYDTHVAGVVSGANGISPGIQMQQQGILEGGKNVALTGRVYVQADASNGAIRPGDLLTTSSMPGDAMKVTDHARASGAILGKAMTGLSEGRGMVLVLVTLQ